MQYIIEIMKHDEIICHVNTYHKARQMYNMVRNTSNAEVEMYKFADYIKLHPDFVNNYYAVLRRS